MIALALAAIPKPPDLAVLVAGVVMIVFLAAILVSWFERVDEDAQVRFAAAVVGASIIVLLWAAVSHAATLSRCTW